MRWRPALVSGQLGAITPFAQSARYATTFVSKGNLPTDGTTAINMGSTGNNEGGFAAPIITGLHNNGQLDRLMGDQNGTIYLCTQAQQCPRAAAAYFTFVPIPATLYLSFYGRPPPASIASRQHAF